MKKELKIKDIKHLASFLGVSTSNLKHLAKEFSKHCYSRTIETKKGKKRDVITTTKEYKLLQRKILALLKKIEISPCAHGWVTGRSPKTNAQVHCKYSYKLSVDLKDCFSNIHSTRVRKLFQEKLDCSPIVANILTRLTTYDFILPQGFSTSPMIVNLLLKNVDDKIQNLASHYSMKYTRFGDDFTLSGDHYIKNIMENVVSIITTNGFKINPAKSQDNYNGKSFLITGLNTEGAKPKIPRKYKNLLRAEKHSLSKMTNKCSMIKKEQVIKGKEQYISFIQGS